VKYLTQKNPQPPTLKAQIKIHNPDNAIRPVVNNMNAPSYKISKFLAKKLNGYLNLDYQFNVTDSLTLANDLIKLKIDQNSRMITFDIKDLYVNIPIEETLQITEAYLSKHNNERITQQIIMLIQTILNQNYFSFQNKIYRPEKGVSMGSPISNTIAEIFLQNL